MNAYKTLIASVALFASLIGDVLALPIENTGFFLTIGRPDISSSFITTTYDANAVASDIGLLSASGFASQLLEQDGTTSAIAGGSFDLIAEIFSSGADQGDANGGSLSIGGTVAGLGFNSGTLLTGALSGFGSEAGSSALEFAFNITGGDAAGLYGGIGAIAGVTLSNTGLPLPPGGTAGAFGSDFASAALAGVSNTAASVPAPGSLVLFAIGGVAFFARRGRAHHV